MGILKTWIQPRRGEADTVNGVHRIGTAMTDSSLVPWSLCLCVLNQKGRANFRNSHKRKTGAEKHNGSGLFRSPETSLSREAIYWHMPGYLQAYIKETVWRTTPVSVIRAGNYKLLEFFEDNRLELYNLANDLGEKQNLAEKLPEKTRELHAKLVAWRKSTGAAMPRMKTKEELAAPKDPRKKRRKKKP